MMQFPLAGDTRVPPERSRLERLRGIARPDLLRLALEQLLRGWHPSEVSSEEMAAYDRMYGVEARQAREIRTAIFADVLDVFLVDGALSPAEQGYLRDLQEALDLDPVDVQDVHERLGAPHFRAALTAAIADGAVTAEERADLARLASDLKIPGEVADRAVESTARRLLDRVWKAATASGRLPERLAPRVREAAEALGIPLAAEQEQVVRAIEACVAERRAQEERLRVQREQERAERERTAEERRRRAADERARTDRMLRDLQEALSRSELPVLDAPIRMNPGERCHCAQPADWHELQSNPADRFAAPGLALLDRGVIYVTDRRVVFEGKRMLSVIRFGDISSVTRHPDGLKIERRADPAIYLLMWPVARVVAVMGVLSHLSATTDR